MRLLVQRQTQACGIKFFWDLEAQKGVNTTSGKDWLFVGCVYMSMCMSLCVCVCEQYICVGRAHVNACIYKCECGHSHLGFRRHPWVVVFTFYLVWDRISCCSFSMYDICQAGCLEASRGSTSNLSVEHQDYMLTTCVWLLCKFWAFELGSSFLFGKHFYPRSHLSSLSWKKFVWNI